ncbi:hypothetical protein DFH09DRAFT_1108800 [Mycena vulgaris]|nr:hypothetical protein DFH09DRAFT_1108800 [Mycena vulgaris]
MQRKRHGCGRDPAPTRGQHRDDRLKIKIFTRQRKRDAQIRGTREQCRHPVQALEEAARITARRGIVFHSIDGEVEGEHERLQGAVGMGDGSPPARPGCTRRRSASNQGRGEGEAVVEHEFYEGPRRVSDHRKTNGEQYLECDFVTNLKMGEVRIKVLMQDSCSLRRYATSSSLSTPIKVRVVLTASCVPTAAFCVPPPSSVHIEPFPMLDALRRLFESGSLVGAYFTHANTTLR